MSQNSLQNIFDHVPKKYKIFINKTFINSFYLFFFLLLLISVIFLALGLAKVGDIAFFVWFGFALVIFDFVLFYFFEFFRRRGKNFLDSYLNFKNLYEHNLKDNYGIQLDVVANDEHFLNIIVLLLDDQKFHSVGKQGLTYSFNFENKNIEFTTFQDIDYREKVNSKNNIKLIFRVNQNIKLDDLIFTKNILKKELANELTKKEFDNGINFYSSNQEYKIDNDVLKTFSNLIKSFDVEIVVWKQKVYFVYTLKNKTLLTNVNNLKFYKNSIKTILKEYEENIKVVDLIFNNLLVSSKQIA